MEKAKETEKQMPSIEKLSKIQGRKYFECHIRSRNGGNIFTDIMKNRRGPGHVRIGNKVNK